MNILCSGLDANKYNRVCACEITKLIWDKLVVIYLRMSQFKETEIKLLIDKYELFKMQSDGIIKELFTRFTDINNKHKLLGKTYSNEEMVKENALMSS